MSHETLEMVDYAYFHSIMNCGLIFLGNSSHSVKIFKIQKNIISVIEGCRRRDSCIDLFKNFNFLPLHPQYALSIHTYLLTYLQEGADKSLARPNSRCRRTESIVSLERGFFSCAELQVFSCYRG